MVNFELDKRSPVPFYRQIVDMVLAGISAGAIAPGDRLPTIRELAVKLEVNPNTVVKAYSELRMLGVLDTQQGSGVFVKGHPEESSSRAQKRRAVRVICQDFVGRAQMLNVGIEDLIACLTEMQKRYSRTLPEEK
jgi:GntR family transcriptional regulator